MNISLYHYSIKNRMVARGCGEVAVRCIEQRLKKLNSQKHETIFNLTSNQEAEKQTLVMKHSALIFEIQNSERNDYC